MIDHFADELESFEDVYYAYDRNTQDLRDYREDISFSWSDAASKEINGKFLNPFDDDCSDITKNFQNQIQKLKNINHIITKIENNILRINEQSDQINNKLESCQSKMNESEKHLNQCAIKKSETYSYLNKADLLYKKIEILLAEHKKKLKEYTSLKT